MIKSKMIMQTIRKNLLISICIGLIISGLYLGKSVYNDYYSRSVRISFVYPSIGDGYYPDGERFMMYDFIDNKQVMQALHAMKVNGWYNDLSEAQLQKGLSISLHLAGPVQNKVASLRASGTNYSYYGNEYVISFTQPNPLYLYDSSNMFGLLAENRSQEFIDELIRVNIKDFIENHTDNGEAFLTLSEVVGLNGYDYLDIVNYYDNKLNACLNYLHEKENEGKVYVSQSIGSSFSDLITTYQALKDTDLVRLKSYVSSSHLTNQFDQLINRYNLLIDNQKLNLQKKLDETEITKKAMLNYDHTFTENLVIVAANDNDGIYQARPKTAYDTITMQNLAAAAEATSYDENIKKLTAEIQQYTTATFNQTEFDRIKIVADNMVKELTGKYASLQEKTIQTIQEYQKFSNDNYFITTSQNPDMLTLTKLIKSAILFLMVVVLIILFKVKTSKLEKI